MTMKSLTALFVFLVIATFAKCQTVDFYGKDVVKDVCSQYGMKDDADAKSYMDKICDAADIPNNFIMVPCPNIDNCFALFKNGKLYIVYDIQFFNKVKTFGFTSKAMPKNTIDWVALTVLAHEVGHHMCQHTTNILVSSTLTPVQMELQADEYAGTIVYKLGATLEQAQMAMNSNDVPLEASLTHPGRKDRLDAIAKGWNKEYNKDVIKGNNKVIHDTIPSKDDGRGTQPPIHAAIRPAIIVIPYTKEGQDIRTVFEADPDIAMAVTKIKESFDKRSYNTVDFVAKLRQIEDQKTFKGQNVSDEKGQLIANSGAQIYIEVQLNKTSDNGLNRVAVLLQAYDVSSGLSLASQDCLSNANRSTNTQALTLGAVTQEQQQGDSSIPCNEMFLNTLQASLDRMTNEGMPLTLQITFSQSSKYNSDYLIQDKAFSDVFNDWLVQNTKDVNIGGVTKTLINYNEIRIPYTDEHTGKTTKAPDFAAKIVTFLRTTYNITASRDVKQGIIHITIN